MTFRREPTLYVQALGALLALLVTFQLDWLTAEQAALVLALVTAVVTAVNAWKVRPISPAVFTGVVTAGAALLGAYGLDFSQERVGAVSVVVQMLLTLLTRVQVTPAVDQAATAIPRNEGLVR